MTIAVAYRPDEFGRAALQWAADHATLTDDTIVLINISRGEATLDPGFARGSDVQDVTDRLAAKGLSLEARQTVGDNISEAVLFEAEQAGATLIVVGIRRRSPVGKMLMGSVAQSLLLDSPVPVVAVKS